jgi:hypothetical protein
MFRAIMAIQIVRVVPGLELSLQGSPVPAMPEVAVPENDYPPAGENDVRIARKAGDVFSIPETKPPKLTAQQAFG